MHAATLQSMLPLRDEKVEKAMTPTRVKLLVPPQAGERPQIGRPSLVAACRGHKGCGDLLSFFVFQASCVERDATKDVVLTMLLDDIIERSHLGISRKTITKYLDLLNEWGLVLSKPYGREYTVKIPTINATVAQPPPPIRRTRNTEHTSSDASKRCKDVSLHLSAADLAKGVSLHLKGVVLHLKGVNLHDKDVNLHLYTFDEAAPEAGSEGVLEGTRSLDSLDSLDSLLEPSGSEPEHKGIRPSLHLMTENPATIVASALTSMATASNLSPDQVAASLMLHLVRAFPAVASMLVSPTGEALPPEPAHPKQSTTRRPTPTKKSEELPQLTFFGKEVVEVYERFKGRKQLPTTELYRAANCLGEVLERDGEDTFVRVLTHIRDDAFLNKRRIPRDLMWCKEHYDEHRDLIDLDVSQSQNGTTRSLEDQRKAADLENEQTLAAMLNPPAAYQAHLAKIQKGASNGSKPHTT